MTKARFIYICPNKECSYTSPHIHGSEGVGDTVHVKPIPGTAYLHPELGKQCFEFEVPNEGFARFYEQAGTSALYRCRGEHKGNPEQDNQCICESEGIGKPRWTERCPVHGAPTDKEDRGDLGMPTLGAAAQNLLVQAGVTPEQLPSVIAPGAIFRIEMPTGDTQRARVAQVFLQARDLFLDKNALYGEPDGDDLGMKGQYADMHRKWKRLARTMWFGDPWPEEGETLEEVLMDFMGHCALSIDFLRQAGGVEYEEHMR